MKVKNISELNAYINKKLLKALDNTSNTVEKKLRLNIEKSVYGWAPEQYERTYQVLDSVSRFKAEFKNGKYVAEIYFDPKKIVPILNDYGWNVHASFDNSWGTSDWDSYRLIATLEYGSPNNPYYNHPDHGFIKETVDWLNTEYFRLLKEELKKQGINCS